MVIVRGGKAIATLTYKGVKQKWRIEGTKTEDFWFYLDQIAKQCVMGPKRGYALTCPDIPGICQS